MSRYTGENVGVGWRDVSIIRTRVWINTIPRSKNRPHPARAGDGTEKRVRRKIHAAALAGPCGGFCARRDCMSSPCMCSAAMPSGARACSGPGVCVQRQGWSSSGVRQHSWGKVLPAMLRGYAFRGTGIQSKGRVSLDQLQSSERMKMEDFNPHEEGGVSLLVI